MVFYNVGRGVCTPSLLAERKMEGNTRMLAGNGGAFILVGSTLVHDIGRIWPCPTRPTSLQIFLFSGGPINLVMVSKMLCAGMQVAGSGDFTPRTPQRAVGDWVGSFGSKSPGAQNLATYTTRIVPWMHRNHVKDWEKCHLWAPE